MAIKVANNQSLTAITALPSAVSGGAMTLLETKTASSDATLDFTSNIDDTYDEYVFRFYDIHPSNDGTQFTFQGNAAGGSGYNETITSTIFYAYHNEADNDTTLSYRTAADQAQGTAFQQITTYGIGFGNDASLSGYLRLFNPSSTTFVKHFMGRVNNEYDSSAAYAVDAYVAGYFNTTSAIDEIQFKGSAGNIDSGVIKLYGIS